MLVWEAEEGREELGVVAPPVLWSDTFVLSREWSDTLLRSSSSVGVFVKLALDTGLSRLKKLMVGAAEHRTGLLWLAGKDMF